MAINFKHDVRSDGIQPEGAYIVIVAHRVWQRYLRRDLTVTSITDGAHSVNSLHYQGLAVDLRIKDDETGLPFEGRQQLVAVRELRRHLGSAYDVVLEPTHIHVEYDPKTGGASV